MSDDADRYDLGALRYYLHGYRASNGRISLCWVIPARLWPIMGSLVGPGWGDGMGEYEISRDAAEKLAIAMGGDLRAHLDCHWSIASSEGAPRRWKIEWLGLADRLRKFSDTVDPADRVRELIIVWSRELASLLGADVNGGLEDEYADYPDPPKRGPDKDGIT